MIRATVDTNTLASGSVAATGPIAALVDAWRRGRLDVAVSPHILAELERALRKPYFARRLDPQMREEFLALVREATTVVPITPPVPDAVSSRADNLVLATAESAGATHVVTGDAELRRLGSFRGIAILSAREFLEVLEREGGEPA